MLRCARICVSAFQLAQRRFGDARLAGVHRHDPRQHEVSGKTSNGTFSANFLPFALALRISPCNMVCLSANISTTFSPFSDFVLVSPTFMVLRWGQLLARCSPYILDCAPMTPNKRVDKCSTWVWGRVSMS